MIRAIAFDFDGVLVESVEVKTKAFASLFCNEKPAVIRQILDFHLQHGGVSRFEKFRIIYREILKRPLYESDYDSLCERFAGLVFNEVIQAPWVDGAQEFLRRYSKKYTFFVVSATPQEEIKEIIRRRGVDTVFKEVLGAPTAKDLHLQGVMKRYKLYPEDLIFVGDAKDDWIAAKRSGIRFVWRTSNGSPASDGFTGLSISSLMHLDRCLSDLHAPINLGQ